MQDTKVANNQTELTENSAQDTNVTNNQTELKENNARDANVTNNQTELKRTVRETLTLQTMKQNSKKQCNRH